MSRCRPALVPALAALALAVGCGAGGAPDPAAPGSPAGVGGTRAGGGGGGGGEMTLVVVDVAGVTHELCVLVADTPELQQRGLMFVTDPDLDGHDGMVFVFDRDTDGAFWMRSTRLPLSIAWIRADGTTVSSADMEPCPDSAATCPTYPPGGPYRYAVEVPRGRLADLGISAQSRVTPGPRSCPA